jgi:glycerate kinase
MKILIAPDKFKGSLTSFEVCKAVHAGIQNRKPAATILEFPMADGGDGFAAIMKYYLTTDTIYCDTVDPLGRGITAFYEWDEKDKVAIIEMAVASGLVLLKGKERNPLLTSTFGTGLLMKDAMAKGAKKIILGLGGSATNDAGMGILSALGFQFLSDKNEILQASGENLFDIKDIITPHSIPTIKLEIACDVQNIMYGKEGAAYIYAPQKGANPEQVKYLDDGLKNFAAVLKEKTGKDIATIPGTGAAGGIAAGLLPFFDMELKKGIQLIIDASKIEEQLSDAGLLITGEGKLDKQSSEGKVVGYIAALAKQHHIPCIAVCGQSELDENDINRLGLQKAIPVKDKLVSTKEAMTNAAQLVTKKIAAYFTT